MLKRDQYDVPLAILSLIVIVERSKSYAKLTEETRQRCRITLYSRKDDKRYMPVGLEHFQYFFQIEKLTFSIFFRLNDLVVEFIKPEEFAKELLEKLWVALNREAGSVDLLILRRDMIAFDEAMSSVRKKKIKLLLENNPRLDPKILTVFDQLSSASQMVVKGGIGVEVATKVEQTAAFVVDNIIDSERAVDTISKMITCDDTLYDHSATVAMLAAIVGTKMLAKPLDKKQAKLVAQCGLYHDVGKTCVPAAILNKPGKFTPEEYEVMKTHAIKGEEELSKVCESGLHLDEAVIRVAGEHHENFNGSGYPRGRKGRLEDDENGIHLYSRIVTIADVYSALLMKRVYKEAFEPSKALKIMIGMHEKFDPEIFSYFVKDVMKSIQSNETNDKGKIINIHEGKVSVLKKIS